ncbi:MAG: iron-sulfur cluster carrier protein ApbC, partial [Deltaproteobacteria bacterium]|nr:iron-sulfur cluster carrier protein ApbC [Deltaproteobacteria bacterium]
KDLVTLNMIQNITIDGTKVSFSLVLTTHACPLKAEMEASAREAVLAIEGVEEVDINVTARVPESKKIPDKEAIPGIKNTIAVASGKGGVGKSTVAVNLALALSKAGSRVGLLDIDLYGPSIPMMMGIHEDIQATEDKRLIPLEAHGVKLISVGFMLDEETPLIWRGPLVMQLVQQFLKDVEWGELDYLVIDLPPGTGDAQLTLVQTIPLTGVVAVTTPQDVALIDARRAIKMFTEVKVPILGIVENMSSFICPHCDKETEIFSSGGGKKTSERYDVPLLGKVPIDLKIREGGDAGKPVVQSQPDSAEAKIFTEIASKVAARISIIDLS